MHPTSPAPLTLADAQAWDERDALAHHRAAFSLPADVIYLDGNSLGPPPRGAAPALERMVRGAWGNGLIRSWDAAGWMDAPARVGGKIARLIGAADDEVIVADSTSVTLFKLVAAALRLRPDRHVLLTEAGNFPTDRHVADGISGLMPGIEVRTVPATGLAAAIGSDTAVLLLCHVHYRGGERHDMAALTRAAHAAGALTVWDLSHSVGAVAVNLHAAGADMAVGCGYKFLNGGPGAPAFAYVARALQPMAQSPIQGWIGHAAPFAFSDIYQPGDGMKRFLSGTPGIAGLTALEAGVDQFLTADPALLFSKSAALFDLFAALAAQTSRSLELLTPTQAQLRGSHISFRHANAGALMAALIARGVIGDFRPPDVLRFGLTPLYTRFEDIWRAVQVLAALLQN
jgi:kynureninase